MASRTWFRIYSDKWLSGTIRDETPELRGIFIDLLALAACGQYGDVGLIGLPNGVGLTDSQLKKLLNISKYQLAKAKKRLILTERISVNNANVITIINWQKYQSEYERQKPYRNIKLQSEVITRNYAGEEKEKEKESKKLQKNNVVNIGHKKYKVVN